MDEGGCMFGEEEKGGGGEGEVRHVYYNLLLVFLVLGFPISCSNSLFTLAWNRFMEWFLRTVCLRLH